MSGGSTLSRIKTKNLKKKTNYRTELDLKPEPEPFKEKVKYSILSLGSFKLDDGETFFKI